MSNKPFFSGRIPQELLDRIEDHIKNTGKSKTDILIESLSAYLSFPILSNNPTNNELEARITKLEEKLGNVSIFKAEEFNNKDNMQNQLSLVDDSNKNILPVKIDKTVVEENKSDNGWMLIGEMLIEQITRLPEFKELENKEIDRLKSKIKETRRKTSKEVIIEPYLIKRIAKGSESRGRIAYNVYKKQ